MNNNGFWSNVKNLLKQHEKNLAITKPPQFPVSLRSWHLQGSRIFTDSQK